MCAGDASFFRIGSQRPASAAVTWVAKPGDDAADTEKPVGCPVEAFQADQRVRAGECDCRPFNAVVVADGG